VPKKITSTIPQCDACSPWQFSRRDWWVVIKNTYGELGKDNVGIVAAGVAFFSMLAIFPLITACLSIFGYLADPMELQQQLEVMSQLMPPEAWAILNSQLMDVANAPKAELGVRIVISLLIVLWSAGAGIRAIMRAMNIAYDETEKRGIFTFYGLASSLTLSVTLFMWLALGVIVGVPSALALLKLDGVAAFVTKYLPWMSIVLMFAAATIILYRIGPSRRQAKFKWVMPGTLFATLSWLLISSGFSKFVAAFGTYNKTYGSISAAIVLLVWFWLTAFVIIIGAELNSELERQTRVDTTRGPDLPVGERGAVVADYVIG